MVVIVGASGLLGSELVSSAPHDVVTLTHKDIEISDYRRSWKLLSDIRPKLIVNAAAFTVVDQAEKDPQPTLNSNMVGPWYLSKICNELGCGFVQFSSNFVFNGEKKSPYLEDDNPFPLSWYGFSKLYSEHVARMVPQHFIIRTGQLYGRGGEKKNLDMVDMVIGTIARGWGNLRLIDNQLITPTWAKELAKATWRLIDVAEPGTYHLTNEGYCTWLEFGQAILNILKVDGAIPRVSFEEFSVGRAGRPKYGVIENTKAKKYGITLPPWWVSIQKYLEEKT